jgi:ferredoxin/flavodoxin---NADP+ reductase
VLQAWSQRTPQGRPRRLHLRFWLRPAAICGDTHVTGMQFSSGRPDASAGPAGAALAHLPADMVLRSVGYRGVPIPGLPFDADRGIITNAAGRVLRDGAVVPGEYVAGWIKRGPSGVIGTNKHDAAEIVRCLLAEPQPCPGERSPTPAGSLTCCISATCESSPGRAGKRPKPSRSRAGDDAAPSRSRWLSASCF